MSLLLRKLLCLLPGCLLMAGALRLEAQPQDVKAALSLIRQWQLQQTSYHLRINIEGQFIEQVANLYCYPVVGGRLWKLDNHLLKPNEARMIFEESPSDVVAYFPEINYHVLTKMLPGDADIISSTFQGLTDEDRTLEKAKSSSLGTSGALNELTLVFDPRKLGIHPTTADVTIILRFDNNGKLAEIEQRRLGLKQVAALTYLTFNIDEVKAIMPVTPDPALANPDISYESALEESIIFFMKQKQLQRAGI